MSEQQWLDMPAMCSVNEGNLEVSYMKQTAKELGVPDLLKSLLGVDDD